jgi:serine/threonine protein kinase
VHDLDVIHGRLCSVRLSPISHFQNPRRLTPPQQNVLVGPDGIPRIAGFGSSLMMSRPDLGSDEDVVGFHRGSAPELMRPPKPGKPVTRITKESDMYAFGMLTWEVRLSMVSQITIKHLTGILDLLRKRSVSRRSRSHRRRSSVERRSAATSQKLQWTFSPGMEYGEGVLV